MRRFFVRAFGFFRDLKLQQKLLLSYLVILAVPFAFIAAFVTGRVASIVEERIAYSAGQAFEQAGAFLEYKLYNVRRIANIVFLDEKVNEVLMRDTAAYDWRAQREDMTDLKKLFFSLRDEVNIDRIRLYVRPGLDYSQENYNFFDAAAAEKTRWYRYLAEGGRNSAFCPSDYLTDDPGQEGDRLSYARFMVDQNDLRRRVGILRVDFKKSQVVDILRKSSALKGSFSFVRNEAGDTVAVSDAGLFERSGDSIAEMEASYDGSDTVAKVATPSGEYLFGVSPIETTDWRMLTVIPFSGIIEESARIRDRITLVIIGIAIAAYFLAFLISGSITSRLSGIMAKMRETRHRGPGKLALPVRRDEIGELAVTYDEMIGEIAGLIEREARTRHELRAVELQALQAQINPHFLYNTLDMIKWMARRGMADEIEETLNSLATFYRLSLSEGRETIPIRDEIRHVELYVRIQNMRYRGAIDLRVGAADEALDSGILKVTLQPLVENCILHGIIEKPDKRGRIDISAAKENGNIALSVCDDGVGMDRRTLDSILVSDRARALGFGVKNIHERFKLYYGESFGLSFESAPGAGTKATLRFPALPPETKEAFHG